MCGSGSGSVFRIRIRIQKAPEYGSDTDPDPQHCCTVSLPKLIVLTKMLMIFHIATVHCHIRSGIKTDNLQYSLTFYCQYLCVMN